ncbi:twin-arginine translocation signal domain-containing protein [Desulfonatronum sp. SC1]|uniref:twin-arginine translocation signal domain-containing protein n=1 Tax=Desulfonatronum sp. SC1 TaxID=2109626 RepID=UPI000D310933|nr:hypothetical protein C6366_16890 [Desulfonatronum sp. SC1]
MKAMIGSLKIHLTRRDFMKFSGGAVGIAHHFGMRVLHDPPAAERQGNVRQ